MTKDTPDDRSLQDVLKLEGLSRAHGTAIAVRRYASVGLLVLFGTVLAGQSNPAMPPETERQLAREIYKEMVEIKSGYTTGATTPVAEAAARRLKAAGFPDADVFVGGAIPTKANLVARYRGTGRGRPLLLLAHIDVVEAKREDWTMDPFTLTERDGYFYGRGTGDDKAQAAVWIANLIRYKREGFKPDRDIIVALTADEEGGGPYNGVAWLLKNQRDLIDAEFCLNEGGWGESVAGKRISNDVQLSEKYVINYRLEVTNKGGHSSLPVPDNAIYHLAGALDRLSTFAFPLKTNEVTQAYFRAMAKIEDASVRSDLTKAADGVSGRDGTRGARDHRLERDAADDVRGDAARRRTREKRAAPTRGGERELPRPARREAGIRHGHAEAGDRRRAGERGDRWRRLRRTAVSHAPGSDDRDQLDHEHSLARCVDRAHDGHGRNRRSVPACGRHPDLRRPGLLLRSRRHPVSRTRRAPESAVVL